jgi:hypothetical protein
MRIATQADIDNFMNKAMLDKEIYPYLSTTKTVSEITAQKTDWNYIYMVSENLSCLLKVTIDRPRDNEFSVSLYSKSAFQAGKCIAIIKDLVKRYQPRAINSLVHASNEKSLHLHKKIYGEPWGIEKSVAWNSLKGEYEDLYCFRMILKD